MTSEDLTRANALQSTIKRLEGEIGFLKTPGIGVTINFCARGQNKTLGAGEEFSATILRAVLYDREDDLRQAKKELEAL